MEGQARPNGMVQALSMLWVVVDPEKVDIMLVDLERELSLRVIAILQISLLMAQLEAKTRSSIRTLSPAR